MVKIRVCHVITRLIHGGAQENTLLTVNGLDPKRYEVTLVGGPPLGRRGGILHRVHARVHVMIIPQMRRAVNPVADFIAFWKLYRLFRRANFAIVHTHSTQAGIYGRLAARLAGVPHIIHTV
ncbi:MAG TPA: glycosyltransferase, partial [Candidatus Nanoarchaeia archaeon]|nr:glycosyltransferase [Candidatus Nanoarchaeia archaeon]